MTCLSRHVTSETALSHRSLSLQHQALPSGITTIWHYNHLALQPSGVTAIWHYSHLALQPSGITAIWHYNHLALQPSGVTAIWHYNLLALQPSGVTAIWRYSHLALLQPSCITTIWHYNHLALQPSCTDQCHLGQGTPEHLNPPPPPFPSPLFFIYSQNARYLAVVPFNLDIPEQFHSHNAVMVKVGVKK